MSEYAVEKRETAPKNFFAGDFPTVPETVENQLFSEKISAILEK